MSFVEFSYNRSIHSTTAYSLFELVYGFNPLTVLDLAPLPIEKISSLDGEKKAELVKSIHAKARQRIAKTNETTTNKANKGRKQIIFEPGEWVWVHMGKERFPTKRKTKLDPRGDDLFKYSSALMIMHIKSTFPVSIMLVPLLMSLTFLLLILQI